MILEIGLTILDQILALYLCIRRSSVISKRKSTKYWNIYTKIDSRRKNRDHGLKNDVGRQFYLQLGFNKIVKLPPSKHELLKCSIL